MTKATRNRRRFSRYPMSGSPASVTHQGKTFHAIVTDESIGGLCLVLDGSPQLSIGDSVEIDFRDEKGTIYVRSTQRVDNNQARLGLSWDPPLLDELPPPAKQSTGPSEQSPSATPTVRVTDTVSFEILEQVYYTHGAISVVCDVVGIAPSGQVKLRLCDESKLLDDCRRLSTRTRSQRLLDLENSEFKQTIARLYGVSPTLEAILEYEFS